MWYNTNLLKKEQQMIVHIGQSVMQITQPKLWPNTIYKQIPDLYLFTLT